jgi:hypothetical protein
MNVNHGIHRQKRINTKKTISKMFYYAGTTRFSVQQQTTSPIGHWTITTLPPDSDEVNKPWTSTMGTHRQKRATTKQVPPPKRSIAKREASPKEKHHQKRPTTKTDLPPKEKHHQKNHHEKKISKKL